MAVELYPHQKKAVKELHNGAILWGDVGTGKSLTAAAYYMENEAPKNVIVITTAKKRDSLDWQRDFARFGVGGDPDSSVAGSLVVDSWNNIGTYRNREGCFFIFDEQRVVGSGKWTKDFIKIASRNRWILLSATPGDTWLDYLPVFLANGFYKNRTEFLETHVIYNRWSKFPKVDRYVNVGRLVKHKNSLLVEMKYLRHTTRKTTIIPVDYDQDAFERVLKDRWHIYLERPLRDVAELFLVMRKVVNSSPTRIEAIRSLISKHPKLIVFYNFDYELEALRSLANTTSKVKKSETIQEHEECLNEQTPTLANIESSSSSLLKTQKTTRPSQMLSRSASIVTQPSVQNGLPNTAGRMTSTTTSGDDSPRKKSSTSDDSLSKGSQDLSTRSTAPTKDTSSFQIAEWNGHKHEPIPETDSWLYLVQYQAGSEGWNCIETDAMAFYSLTYSYKQWHQAHGRIDRLNTAYSTLYYYVLLSNSVIDKAIMASLKAKKSFNESRWLAKK